MPALYLSSKFIILPFPKSTQQIVVAATKLLLKQFYRQQQSFSPECLAVSVDKNVFERKLKCTWNLCVWLNYFNEVNLSLVFLKIQNWLFHTFYALNTIKYSYAHVMAVASTFFRIWRISRHDSMIHTMNVGLMQLCFHNIICVHKVMEFW